MTGGAGFIGANFVHYWLGAHPDDRVVVLDALTYAGNLASLADRPSQRPQFTFVHGDIRDDGWSHGCLGSTLDTDRALRGRIARGSLDPGPDAFVDTNVVGTHAMLESGAPALAGRAETAGPVRFHHVSTDEVYGSLGPTTRRSRETTPYAPNSPYAASKAGIRPSGSGLPPYVWAAARSVTARTITARFQFPEKLIPLMIVNALAGKPLPIYGDGLNVRDWLYVEDHCRAIERVLLAGQLGETYNVGGAR